MIITAVQVSFIWSVSLFRCTELAVVDATLFSGDTGH